MNGTLTDKPIQTLAVVGWTREPEEFRAGRWGDPLRATGDGLPKGEAARHGSEEDLWHLWPVGK